MKKTQYHFKLIGPGEDQGHKYYDYGCNFFLGVGHRMFKMIFDKSIAELKKKGQATPDTIMLDRFVVPKRFHKLIFQSIVTQYKDMKKQVSRDGIKVIEGDVDNAVFEKKNNVWIITILVKGRCKDEREGG
jgi:hypothetical protein